MDFIALHKISKTGIYFEESTLFKQIPFDECFISANVSGTFLSNNTWELENKLNVTQGPIKWVTKNVSKKKKNASSEKSSSSIWLQMPLGLIFYLKEKKAKLNNITKILRPQMCSLVLLNCDIIIFIKYYIYTLEYLI